MKNLSLIPVAPVILSMSLTMSFPSLAQTLTNHQTQESSKILLAQKTLNDNYTGIVKEIHNTAQSISVKIQSQHRNRTVKGSGIIVAHEGNTYSVLTACYLVTDGMSCERDNLLPSLSLTLPDGQQQEIELTPETAIFPNPNIDLVLIRFQSDNDYAVATLGNYFPQDNQWLFVAGFSNENFLDSLTLTAGTAEDYYASPFKVKDQYTLSNGTDFIYTNLSKSGMGGGAILDTEGKVVGLHLSSEDAPMSQGNQWQEVRLGYSLGMSTKMILAVLKAAKVNTDHFKISASSAKAVESSQVNDIRSQLLTFQTPSEKATAFDWINYGNSLWRDKQYSKAVQAFDQAINLLGNKANKESLENVYIAKGKALAVQGNYQEALTSFKKATEIFPQSSEAWRLQGLMLANLGQYAEALGAYQKAINQSSSQNFVLQFELGDILGKSERYPEALNAYNQAIALKPNFPVTYSNRGVIYAKQKQWDLALADFNQAIQIDPTYANAYFNRAVVYYLLNQPKLALDSYNKAIQLDAKFAEFKYHQAPTFYKSNIWD